MAQAPQGRQQEPELIQQWLDTTNILIAEAARYAGDRIVGGEHERPDAEVSASMTKIRVMASALLSALNTIPSPSPPAPPLPPGGPS